jgi:GNAT superfamily N-acetyltransferase
MIQNLKIEITRFRPEYQDTVRALILAGLEEHWGYLDESKNPDLKNLTASYEKGTFLVASLDGEIVGTGAFIPHSYETVEVVRMSVAKHLRRLDIGTQILFELCRRAHERGYKRVILETTDTWKDVIKFYQAFGFQVTHAIDGDVYFALELGELFEKMDSDN